MIFSLLNGGFVVPMDKQNILTSQSPNHVAVIMDGNGRWAKARGLKRSDGHEEGMEAVRRITIRASERGIKVLTLYAFSTENWKRPPQEVKFLMQLPVRFFESFVPQLIENNIQVRKMGFSKNVPSITQNAIEKAVEETKENTGMILNFAFNYGGRAEMVESTRTIAEKVKNDELNLKDIDESTLQSNLFTNHLKPYEDVDLLIRSSGEQRLSNFLLWQNAYSEFYFSDLYWPDFTGDILDEALLNYQNRNRRYGGV